MQGGDVVGQSEGVSCTGDMCFMNDRGEAWLMEVREEGINFSRMAWADGK